MPTNIRLGTKEYSTTRVKDRAKFYHRHNSEMPRAVTLNGVVEKNTIINVPTKVRNHLPFVK